MIVLPRIRDTCVYLRPCELSSFFVTLTLKDNFLKGLGLVLWDANVYVRPRKLSLMFKDNLLEGLGLVLPISSNVDVLVLK